MIKRCIIKTDDNAVFKKYSLVVAISNKKCLGYKLYENYFIYAYNIKNYKHNKKDSKKSSKHRKPKIYKTGIFNTKCSKL